MPIDLDIAIGAELPPAEFSWTRATCCSTTSVWALAQDPMDTRELRYLVDDALQVLPTFGVVAPTFHMTDPPPLNFPGIDINLSKVVHAQSRR